MTSSHVVQNPELLGIEEVSEITGRSPSTLYTWRSENRGPESYKLGKTVVYPRDALMQWIQTQRQATTRGGSTTTPGDAA